jgi:hypothetical protein
MQNLSLTGLNQEQGYRSFNLIANSFFGCRVDDPTQIYLWALPTTGSIVGDISASEVHLLHSTFLLQDYISQGITPQKISYPGNTQEVSYTLSLFYKNGGIPLSNEFITVSLLDTNDQVITYKNFSINNVGYVLDSQSFRTTYSGYIRIKIETPPSNAIYLRGISLTPGEIGPSYLFPRYVTDSEINNLGNIISTLFPPGPITSYYRGDKNWTTLDIEALYNTPLDTQVRDLIRYGLTGGVASLDSNGDVPNSELDNAVKTTEDQNVGGLKTFEESLILGPANPPDLNYATSLENLTKGAMDMSGWVIAPTLRYDVNGLYLDIRPTPISMMAWKTKVIKDLVTTPDSNKIINSRMIISYTNLSFSWPGNNGTYWLLGRHKPIMEDPEVISYTIEAAPNDFIGNGTIYDPEVYNQPDQSGDYGTILGRIIVTPTGSYASFEPSTNTDLGYLWPQILPLLADKASLSHTHNSSDLYYQDGQNTYQLSIVAGVLTQTLIV